MAVDMVTQGNAVRAHQAWREGYKRHLEAKGVSADQAADLAARTAYRPDLYATGTMPLSSVDTPTTPAVKQGAAARPLRKPTPALGRLATTTAEFAGEDRPANEDMAFTHAVLCQVGLPRSKVAGESFLRKSGTAWVHVQAGMLDEGNGPVQQPIPYGALPRLALAWVSTFAKRHNTREIPIGDSAAAFLRLMNMDDQGNRYTTLRRQMHALAACRLQLGYQGRTYNGQPVEQFDAWIGGPKHAHQKALWPGVMILSEGYHKELMEYGVPLSNHALHALKGSALALDVYTWMAHRLHRIAGRPVMLHWYSLREQFGQEYQGKDPDKDFKKRFLPALRHAMYEYPKANVKKVTGGLLLLPSPPPIAPRLR